MRDAVIVEAGAPPPARARTPTRLPRPRPPRGPARPPAAHPRRAHRRRPRADRRRHRRHRRPGRRAGAEHHPLRRARRRASPSRCPATTVDRQCGSSQQAVHFAAQGVIAGAYDVVVACGVESMSRVPMGSNVPPAQRPVRARRRRALPRGPGPPGHQRRADRRQVGAVRASELDALRRSSSPPAGRRGPRRPAFRRARSRRSTASGDATSRSARAPPPRPRRAASRPSSDPAMAERFPQIDWTRHRRQRAARSTTAPRPC